MFTIAVPVCTNTSVLTNAVGKNRALACSAVRCSEVWDRICMLIPFVRLTRRGTRM